VPRLALRKLPRGTLAPGKNGTGPRRSWRCKRIRSVASVPWPRCASVSGTWG